MALPTLPASGSTDWYAHYAALDAAARAGALNAKTDFGAVGNDSADDTAALAAAAAAAVSQNRPLYIPAGTYRITAPLDLRGAGLSVRGHSREHTVIKQMTANTPVIQLGRRRQHITDLVATYATAPTSTDTNANAFEFYKAFWGTYERLLALNCARGFYQPQVNYDDGDTTTGNHYFSCTANDWKVIGFAIDGLNFAGYPGANTGSIFNNIYIRNNPAGTMLAYTGRAVSLVRMDEVVFNQLNVEWMLASNLDPIFIETVGGCVFNALHFEQIGSLGFNLALINNSDGARVIVNGMTLSNNQVPSGGNHAIFRYFGNTQVIVNGLYQHDNTITGTFGLARVGGGTAGVASLVAEACDVALFTSLALEEKAAPQQIVRQVNGNMIRWQEGGKNVTTGTAAPTTGTWAVGEKVWRQPPSAGQTMGWICTTAGTPGTWKAMPNLAA